MLIDETNDRLANPTKHQDAPIFSASRFLQPIQPSTNTTATSQGEAMDLDVTPAPSDLPKKAQELSPSIPQHTLSDSKPMLLSKQQSCPARVRHRSKSARRRSNYSSAHPKPSSDSNSMQSWFFLPYVIYKYLDHLLSFTNACSWAHLMYQLVTLLCIAFVLFKVLFSLYNDYSIKFEFFKKCTSQKSNTFF